MSWTLILEQNKVLNQMCIAGVQIQVKSFSTLFFIWNPKNQSFYEREGRPIWKKVDPKIQAI